MKKPYQIAAGRAVQRVRRWAEEKNPVVQLMLPMVEILTLAKQGAGELIREAGMQLILLAMAQEIEDLSGARYRRSPDRQAQRWSREDGFVVVDGQKVPVERQRLRGKSGGEVRLGTYELFQQTRNLDDQVWWKMLRGLTTRNYPLVTRSFAEAYGIEKSAVSERFIQASREKLKALMERPLGELQLCAMVIDGTPFKGRQMIAAIGVAQDGKKTVLGLREGATENATVVRELLEDLARRGLDFVTPRLYVLDGAKALSAAVKRHAGEAALIQRCQVHKRRNVLEQLPEEYQPSIERKLIAAYAMTGEAEARRALEQIHGELERINPSAARSLEEGMEETLTVHKLRMPEMLRKSLSSTNIIESAFSVAEDLCRRVKRWRDGDHRERWAGSALLLAESKFRRVKGYKEIPTLLTGIADHIAMRTKKGLASKAKTA
jgi:transposase-like protein